MANVLELRPEGLYCAAGEFFIDPWRPVKHALITHAHSDHARWGSEQYLCHRLSLPILHQRLSDVRAEGIEYGEKRKIGNAWISFHPAGHILGSAQIRVEAGNEVWVTTGDFKRDQDPTCAPFEPIPCDTLITEATFALPVYRWPPVADVMQDIWDWWQLCQQEGRPAVIFGYALGKAQRILAGLMPYTDRTVYVHGAVEPLVQLYREQGVAMLPTCLISDTDKKDFAGDLILAPPSAAGSPWMKRFKNASTGFCSGWMRIRGNRRRRGYDRGFVLSDHADWPALIQTVDQVRPRQVLPTHGNTDSFVRYLQERGIRAQSLDTAYGDEED